jgi:hypothetical protein
MRKHFVHAMVRDADAERHGVVGGGVATYVERRVEGAASRQSKRPGQPARSRSDNRRPRHAAGRVVGELERRSHRQFLGSAEPPREIDDVDGRRRGRATATGGEEQHEEEGQRDARGKTCLDTPASTC